MRKGFILPIILILLVIALAAGSVAYFKLKPKIPPQTPIVQAKPSISPPPTPTDDTANWKIYTNTKLGFSIKYPSQWTYIKERSGSFPSVNFSVDNPSKVGFYIQISRSNRGSEMSPYDEVSALDVNKTFETSSGDIKNYSTNARLPDVSVDGQIGVKEKQLVNITPSNSDIENVQFGLSSIEVYVRKESYEYNITLWSANKNNLDSNSKIFNQILSTFKFTG